MTRRLIPRVRRAEYRSARTLGDAEALERAAETGSLKPVERRLLRRVLGRALGRTVMRWI